MSLKQLFNRITLATIVAGTTAVTTPVLAQVFAQGFYMPSASFFNSFASTLQSEENAGLVELLALYPDFYSRLEEVDLVDSIEEQDFLTVLLPSEEAFAALSPEMQEKLAEPENMKKLLQYHLIMDKIDKQDLQGKSLETVLEKNSVKITGEQMGDKIQIKLNEATASQPLPANGGVVIPVDKVLIPPEFSAK